TLPEATKVKLIERHEKKFRMAIEQRLTEDFKRHTSVIHLLIHTAPIADGSIILEYSSSDHARIIAEATVNNLPASEITSRSSPLLEKTPLIRWLLENFDSGKYGLIRITVSQSFFLKSIPMRWETIKRSLIQAIEKSSIPHPA
ncbi:MAG: hypothetical protein H7Y36_11565, partial [Armatimonadetes bacterium]|nr:hypothetical protein [Akkermansiaceae bacterium]